MDMPGGERRQGLLQGAHVSAALDVARSYWAAERDRDLELVLSHFSEDAVFRAPTMTLDGREEIRSYYAGVLGSFRSVKVSVLASMEEGERLAVEWRCQLIGNDDREREVLGCNVFSVRDGVIERLHVYFDPKAFD